MNLQDAAGRTRCRSKISAGGMAFRWLHGGYALSKAGAINDDAATSNMLSLGRAGGGIVLVARVVLSASRPAILPAFGMFCGNTHPSRLVLQHAQARVLSRGVHAVFCAVLTLATFGNLFRGVCWTLRAVGW